MKELNTLAWYSSKITPHLPKEAFKPVPTRLFGGLFFLVVAIIGALSIGMFELNLWINLGISIIIGLCFTSLGFFSHEILHGTIVRKAWIRDLLGAIAFWPLCTGPSLWRKWHNMNHHVHTQEGVNDPDAWPSINQLASSPVIVRLAYKLPLTIRSIFSFSLLTITFTMHSTRMFFVFLSDFKSYQRPKVWLQFILPWVSWIALLVWVGLVNWLFIFLIPHMIANAIVMAYIATNHRLNALMPVNDPLANSLTVTVPKIVNLMHFNFSYHAEHHLYPSMNPKYYPLVQEQIKKMWPERYFEMPFGRALIALWKTPRTYHNNNDLVDPEPGNKYGTLGNGLDPNHIKAEKADLGYEELILAPKVPSVESDPKGKDV
jgi:fatty acid desaturase